MAEFVELVFGYVQSLFGYFTWGNVKFLTIAIAVVWILVALNRRVGVLSLLGELGERLFGSHVAGLKARGEAVSAEKTGEWLTAGLHYDKLGDWEKALDCYEKAEEYHLAGEICVRLGHKDVAAEWFLLSDEKLRAAQLYKELGQHKKAAEAFLKAGSSLEAAPEFLEAGEFDKAAEIYERSGNHLRVAEAYERGNDLALALARASPVRWRRSKGAVVTIVR